MKKDDVIFSSGAHFVSFPISVNPVELTMQKRYNALGYVRRESL